jgi:hypothetical protein
MKMNWEAWAWVTWILAFAVLETVGLLRRPDGMTLTYFLENHVPRWAMASLIGWLAYHFLIAGPARG